MSSLGGGAAVPEGGMEAAGGVLPVPTRTPLGEATVPGLLRVGFRN